MKITVIVGGSSDPSNSETLADAFIDGMKAQGAEVEKFVLRALRIEPFTIACYEPGADEEPDFAAIRRAVQSSDGLVLASPIWNFGIPGNLKNLIDRFGSFSLDAERRMRGQWKDTPFYLIFTGGSPMAAWRGLLRRTLSGVHTSLQYYGGAHAGTSFEPRCTPGKGRFGMVVDSRPESLADARSRGESFAMLVGAHAASGMLPWRMRFMRRFYAIGQKIQRKLF